MFLRYNALLLNILPEHRRRGADQQIDDIDQIEIELAHCGFDGSKALPGSVRRVR